MNKKKQVFRKGAFDMLRAGAASLLFTLAVVVMIAFALHQTEISNRAEGARLLEEGLLRATLHCYAIEGSYPENLAYITENYGISIDRSKYIVRYDVFASNIMPEIAVFEVGR